VPDYLLPRPNAEIVILILARSRVLAASVFTGWAWTGSPNPICALSNTNDRRLYPSLITLVGVIWTRNRAKPGALIKFIRVLIACGRR
jgi:hypothetical protein